MTEGKCIEKYLWIISVIFITYLFLGSYIVGKNISDLIYLILLYGTIVVIKIRCNK